MSKRLSTKNLVLTALLASLTCIATMIITIPSPLKGYINLGDCVVLSAGWLLSPWYGFFAAGLGSGLADVVSGYILYAPATFVIKGLMALTAGLLFKLLCGLKKSSKSDNLVARVVSGTAAEIIMIAGYYALESVLYGARASLANIPANAVQGVVGVILGCVLIRVLKKIKLR